ncbi:hypothetical protein ES707_17057 [subsurface metagenome]
MSNGLVLDWLTITGLAVSLLTLLLVIFTIFWGTGLWARRERVEINVTKPNYSVNDFDRVLRVFWSCELRRLGGEEVRYTSHICLKPDAQIYHRLKKYFNLPQDGVIRTPNRLELAREKIVSTGHGVDTGVYPEYDALMETNDIEKWKIAGQLASELESKRFEVSLVWEDNPSKKPKWRIIKQGDYGWITL